MVAQGVEEVKKKQQQQQQQQQQLGHKGFIFTEIRKDLVIWRPVTSKNVGRAGGPVVRVQDCERKGPRIQPHYR